MSDTPDFTMNHNMHSAFKRELRRLHTALTAADLSDGAAVAGLQRRYSFFSDTLHVHHQGEDRFLWPSALDKATPAEKVVLVAMESEHGDLQRVLGELDEGFSSLGTGTDTAVLGARFDELAVVLDGHCAHEERDAVPIVQKYVTPEEMKAFMKFTREQKDSILVLPWVCDGATPTEQETTWGMLPGFVRVFVKPMASRKYRAFTAACGV
ncbi:MAG: hemerythrin domain-containing protein [Candidatus Nanopelagicales bacterium]